MSPHSTYDTLRHLADSWGLAVMMIVFLALCAWPFLRPGGKQRGDDAANVIFRDENDG